MQTLIVESGPKLVQSNFDLFFMRGKLGADGVPISIWERSFAKEISKVVFDLTLLEWINSEQILFLFAWIRNIKLSGKKVLIRLPFRNDLKGSGKYNESELHHWAMKYKDEAGKPFEESVDRIERRKKRSAYLMAIWGMFDRLGLQEEDFENSAEWSTYNRESQKLKENNVQIIPFSTLEISIDRGGLKFDSHYLRLISDVNQSSTGIFELAEELKKILKNYACYSPFESKIISNVITQELYINSLQHSFEEHADSLQECYTLAFLSNRWKKVGKHFTQSFVGEKYPQTLEFYKDKIQITQQINQQLKDERFKKLPSRLADLSRYLLFSNRSYLEYSFLDFGSGIHRTLGSAFENFKKLGDDDVDKVLHKSLLSEAFWNAPLDSQIIEFAFLIDTSRHTLDRSIDNYDLVPRGLYFLVEMVKRYQGLLIIRSGKARVSYDFSNKIFIDNTTGDPKAVEKPVIYIKDAVSHAKEQPYFPGTLISIVLPDRTIRTDSANAIISAVRVEDEVLSKYVYQITQKDFNAPINPLEDFHPVRYIYISILFIYNKVIEDLKSSQKPVGVQDIYNYLFRDLNKKLDEHKNESSLLFFDFAGLKTGNPSWIKALYFLMNTPKINEKTKAIIMNLPSDENKIISEIKENIVSKKGTNGKTVDGLYDPFLFRPIPCINFGFEREERSSISWIGLKKTEHEDLLTNLILGEKDAYELSHFEEPNVMEGSLFVKQEGWVHSTVKGFEKIKKTFFEEQKSAIVEFLRSYIQDGVDTVSGVENYVFLAANGGYQFQYLSLYELLHDKYVARYFAKCLLDKYSFQIELSRANRNEAFLQKELTQIDNYRFTKIVAVTISSQLLGAAIRDLIETDDNYSFLRINEKKEGGLDSAPELIMLSSYYSFDTEKPFEKIIENDRVLIVNDVISTGGLVEQIISKIEERKKAIITGVFSIMDSRIPIDKIDPEKELPSIFLKDEYEKSFLTLVSYHDGIVLRKYLGPYRGPAETKRINPLLNTIVELKTSHSEPNKVLFRDPKQLLKDDVIKEEHFKIGHFQQNLTHNGYLTNMRPLFSSAAGVHILKKLKGSLEPFLLKYDKDDFKSHLLLQVVKLEDIWETLSESLPSARFIDVLFRLKESVDNLAGQIREDEQLTPVKSRFTPGVIFYPIFSGIERMEHNQLSSIFGTHPDNIIGLQRFDTPKGWRFPFPAKRFNRLTKDKSVLILDSGSLTGDSLVQLIDNIGFLEVKEITVLSVVTRIEEFYREFHSRLKSIKVKKLRSKEHGNNQEKQLHVDKIIPIEIYFGINLHIPVYPSSVSCPFCDEIRMLNDFLGDEYVSEPSFAVRAYINNRNKELLVQAPSKEQLGNAVYLPHIKNTKEVDSKNIFYTRDLIGKIDSYRFYPDYFDYFNKLQKEIYSDPKWKRNKEIQGKIERIMICLLHEPFLKDLIKNYLNALLTSINEYVHYFLFADKENKQMMFYDWSIYSLTRLFLLLRNETHPITLVEFETILTWKDTDAIQYLHYYFWHQLYYKDSTELQKTNTETLLRAFGKMYEEEAGEKRAVYSDANFEFFRLLTLPYKINAISKSSRLTESFYNLSKFVLQGQSEGRHFFLKEKLIEVIDSIVSTEPNLNDIRHHLGEVRLIFEKELIPSIKRIVSDNQLKFSAKTIYSLLSNENGGLLSYMEEIINEYQNIISFEQSEIEMAKPYLQKISSYCKDMVTKVLINDPNNECFYKVCTLYPCDFNQSINEFKNKQRQNIRIEVKGEKEIGRYPVMIKFHKYLLDKVLLEIFNNAVRSNDDIELNVIYTVNNKTNFLIVEIVQNKPFLKDEVDKKLKQSTGGLNKVVKHFVSQFEGFFISNSEESLNNGDNYSIRLELQLHKYEQ